MAFDIAARKKKNSLTEETVHIKRTWQDNLFNVLNCLFFSAFTLSCIFPFYYIFINTISSNDLVKRGAITFIPRGLTISNYIAMGKVPDLWNSLRVTVWRTLIGTVHQPRRDHARRMGRRNVQGRLVCRQ